MWFCFNEGFLSVVEDRKDSNMLLIRGRRREDLEKVLGRERKIEVTKSNDYRFRTKMSREDFSLLVMSHISEINYHNFKDSVEDDDLHDLYSNMWYEHFQYQCKKYGFPDYKLKLKATTAVNKKQF